MIDVTFLLIVFFVLVSQIVDLESVQMDLPRPRDPASELAAEENRVVLSVIPSPDGDAAGYKLGPRVHAADARGVQELTQSLAVLLRTNPGLRVNLRADRAAHYRAVEPALQAVAEAGRLAQRGGRAGVNLVVVREE
jgi:biopolymer transport protein ExbD